MVVERAFQKEVKKGQRRDIYIKKGGWGRSKSDHNPDYAGGTQVAGYLDIYRLIKQ